MTEPNPTDLLKARALQLGFSSVGVCEATAPPHLAAYRDWLGAGRHGGMSYLEKQLPLKGSPTSLLTRAKSVVAVSLSYAQENPTKEGSPRIAAYALGRDYHKVLRAKLRKLKSWIDERFPESESRACVDSAPIMERDYAQLAGLGWFGKNTCLIDSKRGSWFFIGLLLTSVEFAPDTPAAGSCGSCRKCIDACPTGAIVFDDGRWQVDSRRCISYLTIEHRGPIDPNLASRIGDWTFGCDVCQSVCPFNEQRRTQPLRGVASTEPDFLASRPWPSLSELKDISHEDWDLLTRGSAVRRTGHTGLKRNAAINLANAKN